MADAQVAGWGEGASGAEGARPVAALTVGGSGVPVLRVAMKAVVPSALSLAQVVPVQRAAAAPTPMLPGLPALRAPGRRGFHDLADRRAQPRFLLGLPVRLFVAGIAAASTVELRDVSLGGGFLCTGDDTPAVGPNQEVALGFFLPSKEVALGRGRVCRVVPGVGFAIVFDSQNAAFERFVRSLDDGQGGLPA